MISVMYRQTNLEKKIKRMAWYYICCPNCTQAKVSLKFGISKSKVSEYFNFYLPAISLRLYKLVSNKKQRNIKRSHKKFEKRFANKK